MAISKEMRKLINKWKTGNSWPKRLEWLEIQGSEVGLVRG
ncbi:Uncharacterised protein [Klebsiella pneumoniae]|uniref:Uncharacterized protein n=1 Tax=Klebsiella pneumoniae TaxID=573 RepID=A0A2X3IV25_KLEPN|nr:Uncharacterised protein [Klebsiella pneumoniae]